jgi:hypothetical protein
MARGRGGSSSDIPFVSGAAAQEGVVRGAKSVEIGSPFIPQYGFLKHESISVPAKDVGFYDLLSSLGKQEYDKYVKLETANSVADSTAALTLWFKQNTNEFKNKTQDGSGYIEDFNQKFSSKVEDIGQALSFDAKNLFEVQAQQNRVTYLNSLFDIEQTHKLANITNNQLVAIGAAQQSVYSDASTYMAAKRDYGNAMAVIQQTMGQDKFLEFKRKEDDVFYSSMVKGRILEDKAISESASIILSELKQSKEEWVKNLQPTTRMKLTEKAQANIRANLILEHQKAKELTKKTSLEDIFKGEAIKDQITVDAANFEIKPFYMYEANLNITGKGVSKEVKEFYARNLKAQNKVVGDYDNVRTLIVEGKSLLGVSVKEQDNYLAYRIKKEWSDNEGNIDLVKMAKETANLSFSKASVLVDNLIMSNASGANLVNKYNALAAANVYMNSEGNFYKNIPEQVVAAAVILKNRNLSLDDIRNGTDGAKKVMDDVDGALKGLSGRGAEQALKEFVKSTEFTRANHLKFIKHVSDEGWLEGKYVGREDPALISFVEEAHKTGYLLTGRPTDAEKYVKETLKNSIAVNNFNGKKEIFLGGLFVQQRGNANFEKTLREKINIHIDRLSAAGLAIKREGNSVLYHGIKHRIVVRNAAPFVNRLNVGLVQEDIDYDGRIMTPLPEKTDGAGIFFLEGDD